MFPEVTGEQLVGGTFLPPPHVYRKKNIVFSTFNYSKLV